MNSNRLLGRNSILLMKPTHFSSSSAIRKSKKSVWTKSYFLKKFNLYSQTVLLCFHFQLLTSLNLSNPFVFLMQIRQCMRSIRNLKTKKMVSCTLHTLMLKVSELAMLDNIENEITLPQNKGHPFPSYAWY